MRNGQNKRMRGRNNRKSQNPLTRVYESNGPDVKIRGTASHIAEKYIQLARDAQGSGDPVGAENYYQHAEHYFRLIAAAQEQFRQTQPFYQQGGEARSDEMFDDEEDGVPAMGVEPSYAPREPQPYMPREAREGQPYSPREPQPYLPREQQPNFGRAQQPAAAGEEGHDVGLPSFITGGQQQAQGYPSNGHDNGGGGGNGPDRFPLHRRRRRHRSPRGEAGASAGDDAARQGE